MVGFQKIFPPYTWLTLLFIFYTLFSLPMPIEDGGLHRCFGKHFLRLASSWPPAGKNPSVTVIRAQKHELLA